MSTHELEEVDRWLRNKGYKLVVSRAYPELRGATYRVYSHRLASRSRVAFPEVAGRVLTRHFERIKAVVEIQEEFGG